MDIKPQRLTVKEFLEQEGYEGLLDLVEEYFDSSEVPALCEAGCTVEPDGKCPHGHPSILLATGLV
jgi:hypothetical protein